MRLVIVGNSAAALSALDTFRGYDHEASVTLVSQEPGTAYSRVLLPYFLRRRIPYAGLFIRTPESYSRMGAVLVSGPGARVERVEPTDRRLELADGRHLAYDRLLIATGSRPVKPRVHGLDHPAVHHLWTVDDALRLDPLLRDRARILVLGSGFVALQAAWAARCRGLDVKVVELEERIMPRVLDDRASRLLHESLEAHGVTVHVGTRTEALENDGDGAVRVHVASLDSFTADLVVVATGVRPNDGLLSEAVEPGSPGIAVTATMATEVEDVFAAGDVTRGPTALGGPREIHALWPTAVEQGAIAGANLAGAALAYSGSLSMNVTEMFGLTVASLGRFVERRGDDVLVYDHLPGIRYLKLVSRHGVPVGAIALGDARGASLLGQLRPFVRYGRAMADPQALLAGDGSLRVLAGGAAAHAALGRRPGSQEVERCASWR
jgi:nitrite reductase (NADH) large subunit